MNDHVNGTMAGILNSFVRCPACKFWEDLEENDERGYGIGLCHRFPPIHKSDGESYWHPVCCEYDWCGEYAPNNSNDASAVSR